ncbi:MAG: 2-oxo acid dehydrogenase subunit E2 [Planctomycetes bacterium]|nr:2-oxo acid dehydrogenase subunit E2 [Planctomycetota bacterium]
MAMEVKLPQLGQTMEEGTIVSCMVKLGDKINRGDIIFEVETDKAALEMESPAQGYVKHILVETGQTIAVGEVVLVLGEKDEEVSIGGSGAAVETKAEDEVAAEEPGQAAVAAVADSVKVVKLPQLGQTMEEGTIVGCMIKPGDEVKRGDVIFEVETDKAALEMESPAEGFVKHILVDIGQTILVGRAVVILAGKGDDVPGSYADYVKAGGGVESVVVERPCEASAVAEKIEPVKAVSASTGGKVIASPRAKNLAKKLGVDISLVNGTGPGGRIIEKDVEAAKGSAGAAAESSFAAGERIALNRLQKITAKKMLQSKREIPCFYLTVKVDVTDLVHFRTLRNKKADIKVSYNDLIMKAVAVGLVKFPIMTGQLDGDAIRLADSIGIGLAISVGDGLVAPIVKDIDKKDIAAVAAASREIIEKAQNNKLAPADVEGGCITVSNLGAFGIESFIPIVVPGQCSILGIGQISDVCVPIDDNIMVRKIMSMTLSVDHKVANGAYAAQFLDFVRKVLEDTANFQ